MSQRVSFALIENIAGGKRGKAAGSCPAFRRGKGGSEGLGERVEAAGKVKLARELGRYGLFVLGAEILFKNEMYGELRQFAERAGKRGGPGALYAKMLVAIIDDDAEGKAACGTALCKSGAWGSYLFGKACLGIRESEVRATADWFVRQAEDGPQGGVATGDMESDVDSVLSWMSSSCAEKLFYAMKLYRIVGDMEKMQECLGRLGATGSEYYDYALSLLDGRGAKVESMKDGGVRMHTLAYRMAGTIQGLGDMDAGTKYGFFSEGLGKLERVLEERIDEASLGLALGVIEKSMRILAEHESAKIKGAGVIAASGMRSGDLEEIRRAGEMLDEVDVELIECAGIEISIRETRIKVADAAYALERDMEAQVFAGGIYARGVDEKMFICIRRLVEGGKVKEAGRIAASGARHGREAGEEWNGKLRAITEEIGKKHRAFGLKVYAEMEDMGMVQRVARRIMENGGTIEELEDAATVVAAHAGKSALMRELLSALEGKGEEGRIAAGAIRREFGIRPVLSVVA